MFKYRFLVIAGTALFILDRLLKYYALTLPPGEVFSFLNLDFGYFLNPTLFFLPAWPWIPWLALIVLIVITLLFIIKLHEYKRTKTNATCYVLRVLCPILLGGASNVFDRFAYGGVIDVIHIRELATLNVADVLIFTGFIGLVKLSKKW